MFKRSILPLSVLLLAFVGTAIADAPTSAPAPSTTSTSSTTSTTTSTTSTTTTSTTTTTLPDPAQLLAEDKARINGLVYSYGDPAPALAAFVAVTTWRGWSAESIEAWTPFVTDVMRRESGYCYNLRRGASIASSEGCVMKRQGPHSDSGFGQVISIHYKPGAWLCEQESLCSADDIIADAWSSMTALVALMERNGRQPWCFTDSLRATAVCRNAPANPPTP